MGLDMIELVLELEETFDIKLSDEEFSEVRTVGDLIGLIQRKVDPERLQKGEYCQTSRAFYKLRRQLLSMLPISRRDIRVSTKFLSLLSGIPEPRQRQIWQELRETGSALPRLVRSPLVVILCTIVVMFLTSSLCLIFRHQWPLTSTGWIVFMGLCIFGTLALLAYEVTIPLAVHIPNTSNTIRDIIIRQIQVPSGSQAHSPSDDRDQGYITRKEITNVVRRIISDHLAVEIKELKNDTRFIEDLNC